MSALEDVDRVDLNAGAGTVIVRNGAALLAVDGSGRLVLNGAVTDTADVRIVGVRGFRPSAGTFAERPAGATDGDLRFRSDVGVVEYHLGGNWYTPAGAFAASSLIPCRWATGTFTGTTLTIPDLDDAAVIIVTLDHVRRQPSGGAEFWMRFYIDGTLQNSQAYHWAGRGYRGDPWNAAWEFRNAIIGGTATTNADAAAISPYGYVVKSRSSRFTVQIWNVGMFDETNGQATYIGYGRYYITSPVRPILTDLSGRCTVAGRVTGLWFGLDDLSGFRARWRVILVHRT